MILAQKNNQPMTYGTRNTHFHGDLIRDMALPANGENSINYSSV